MRLDPIELNDGRKIPSIAFGTGSALFRRDAVQYVVQAIYTGLSHIDTAQQYENESSTGTALKETGVARNDVWITTKYHSPGGTGPRSALLESLKKLGVKFVDLYLIHHPSSVSDIPRTWSEMEDTVKEGLTKSIGVSNFTVEHLELLMKHTRITPAVNQINFSPYQLHKMLPVLKYCQKHGIFIEAYGSLAPITKQSGGPVDVPVKKAAERLKATPAQVLFLWVRQKGCVIVTTSSKRERLEEYLAIGDLESLTAEEIHAIDDAGMKGSALFALDPLIRGRLGQLQLLLLTLSFIALSWYTVAHQYGTMGLFQDTLTIFVWTSSLFTLVLQTCRFYIRLRTTIK
ncbi:hypothetical protein FRB94_003237 [Tulasnella sp. JGI-2019a]|nr:hypothetical protein FRB94_003237 [Tulasnella sp. JGI-2019a]